MQAHLGSNQWMRPSTWGHDGLCEPRPGHGGDGVTKDVVLAALDGQSVGQPQQAQLGGAVVGLAEIAVDSRRWGRHDDSGRERDSQQTRQCCREEKSFCYSFFSCLNPSVQKKQQGSELGHCLRGFLKKLHWKMAANQKQDSHCFNSFNFSKSEKRDYFNVLCVSTLINPIMGYRGDSSHCKNHQSS